ncbi:MAG TPA: endonuclease III [Candidatus Nanoarchaeia archaeon]|nr:endonuclease III [Candidatus Nanoarchaeia archaeon]
MNSNKALKQLNEIEKLSDKPRLAAEGWNEDWKTLIAILMSARTLDKTTIPVAQELFDKYTSLEKLSKAKLAEIGKIIFPVNFYKHKSRYISELSKILLRDYDGNVPREFEKLIELPGVGRKTANVFLAEQGEGRIGVDTHVNWVSKQMGWTKSDKQEQVEKDLAKIFPKKIHGKVNEILVRFGQTHRSRAKKIEMLKKIKKN